MRVAGWFALLMLVAGQQAVGAEQHDDHLRVDCGMTGSTVAISDRNGVGFIVEIKVNTHENIALGGRVETAVMFGGRVRDEELPFGFLAAALIKGEYLVGSASVRPYVAFGLGLYSMSSHSIVSESNGRSGFSTTTGRYFGVAPEAGVDLGRLRLALTYNAIAGTSVEHRHTTGGVEHRESFSHNYLSLQASFRFVGGAGPKKAPDRA